MNGQVCRGCVAFILSEAVCMLSDGLTWDGSDVAFASMSPPNGIVEAY